MRRIAVTTAGIMTHESVPEQVSQCLMEWFVEILRDTSCSSFRIGSKPIPGEQSPIVLNLF
jgi:hypothetical protein